MSRYTVVWHPSCEADVADFWLTCRDPSRLTDAANKLDSLLQRAPSQTGVDLHEGLRVVTIPPLKAIFSVSEADRLVEVWQIKLVASPESSN
jgi:hypothetical protein